MSERDDSGRPAEQETAPSYGGTPTTIAPRKLRLVGLVALIVAFLIIGGGILSRALKAQDVARWTDSIAIPTVSIIHPQRGAPGQETVLPGNVQAWYQAPIYARVNGYLKNWYYDFGAHVKKGAVLADIDAPDVDAQLAAAQADLKATQAQVKVRQAEMDFAQTTYVRWRDSPKGVVSEQEQESKKADFGTATARYDASLASVNADRGLVDRLAALEQFKHLLAPFDGVVTSRNTDIGALISAGSGSGGSSPPQLFRVADVHEMRVFVQVPQEISAGLQQGMSAELHMPQYPRRVFKAVVATTAQAIDPDARTLLVELHADNSAGLLQPGMFAEVHFELPSDPTVVLVPTSALVFRESGIQVAVLGPGDHAELRSVSLGRNLGTQVEVLSGLTAADQIIDSPPDSLADGDLVSVQTPQVALAARIGTQ